MQRGRYPSRHDGDDTAQLVERSTAVARTGSAIVAAANARNDDRHDAQREQRRRQQG